MYAWFVDANDVDQGIWQSLNGGLSWTQINDSGITNCGDFFGGCGTAQGKYNLALAAVPNGTATDLYAGTVNLYKCTITNAFPACNGSGNNTFLNLTHVYGCSDIAKVHPDQHAIDFAVSAGTALLYFANDGGIYRALDGFTGLTTDTCGEVNQFDNLNASLGPFTQFVSISESATDVNSIFGGTQDDGAPATAFSQTGGDWANIDAGDNGFTAANPVNDGEWFVAAPPDSVSGVNLFRCVNGANCRTQDFENDQVVDSNELGGDTGAFYVPFILDPANPSSLLLGTCRVWRGASAGGSFSVLSPDFETGGSGACTGNEVNLVRSLAAGGPKDSSGNSQVIYAGTSGLGPLIPIAPLGGHIWITTAADSGPNSWIDRTGAINPNGFPISAIALDPADLSGHTAYITIMGFRTVNFHTSHVWQTTNAGFSWTDFSANLPDAPVNSIVIDPGISGSPGTIYVGTDVGVFATSSSAANWVEVDPDPGVAGFLPNVAVTSLRIFTATGTKRLRAGTHGRGIWEWNLITTPDFQMVITNNPQTILAGARATFNGTIWARNGYNSSVTLGCGGGNTPAPQVCSTTPNSLVPSSLGNNFQVNAGGTAGDYLFIVRGSGIDPARVTHIFPVTLHIVDFSLSPISPSTVTVAPGATSAPVSFIVSAAGAFKSAVTLSCAGQPTGAACSFKPSSVVNPTSAVPVAVTMTISTIATTAPGSLQVTVNAAASGEPVKSQNLTLVISPAQDYAVAISNPSLTTQINSPAVFNGLLSTTSGYNSAVALSCGSGAPPNCNPNPTSLVPTAAGAAFTVSVASNVSQSYPFNINVVGNDPAAIAHSAAVTLTVLPDQSFDFSMGVNPQSASVPVGQSASYTADVNPNSGTFPNDATFSCSQLPSLSTCSFNPARIGVGSGNSATALTITTAAPTASGLQAGMLLMLLPIAGIFFVRPPGLSRRFRRTLLVWSLILSCISCGGGLQGNGGAGSANPGTPKGTYTITVNAACGAVTHGSAISLTVK